jgi:ankyrin repeat protein
LGDVQLLQYLLTAGYTVNDSTGGEEGYTALAEAVMSQRTEAVKFLVDSGATVHNEVIKMAGTVEIFDILRFHVDQQSLEAYGVLQIASANRNPELVLHMISIGMDVNGRHNGLTGLMSAVTRKDSSEVIKLLLSKGADVSLQSMDTGDTACAFPTYSLRTGTNPISAQSFLLVRY